ncbi:hypothetical protein PG990_003463 [Apiospora arundinis]
MDLYKLKVVKANWTAAGFPADRTEAVFLDFGSGIFRLYKTARAQCGLAWPGAWTESNSTKAASRGAKTPRETFLSHPTSCASRKRQYQVARSRNARPGTARYRQAPQGTARDRQGRRIPLRLGHLAWSNPMTGSAENSDFSAQKGCLGSDAPPPEYTTHAAAWQS